MIGAFDAILLNIMIDMEVQEGARNKDIIKLVQAKYKSLPADFIASHILKRRIKWVKLLLYNFHSLNSWGLHEYNWEWACEEEHIPSKYKVYKNTPEGFVLKIMLEEALEKYGEKEPKLKELLSKYYIDSNTIKELTEHFQVCRKTVYNRLDKAIEGIAALFGNSSCEQQNNDDLKKIKKIY